MSSRFIRCMFSLLLLVSFFHSDCSGGAELQTDGDTSSRRRVLVFSATRGYRHASIPQAIDAINKLGRKNGFAVDASEDPRVFTAQNLKKYRVVIFASTTGSFFNDSEKLAFQDFIRGGGGFLGIHAAADTFYDWPWYGEMLGGYFKSHPKIQEATLHILDKDHPSTTILPSSWRRRDEWYNFKSLREDNQVLITIDEQSYKGGENGVNHPVTWYREFQGGRIFYTALGHTEGSYSEPEFLNHLQGALKWLMRD